MIFANTTKTTFAAKGSLAISLATLTLAGCSSVTKTPIEQIMAVQYIVPAAKPGTVIEGLPSADDPVAMAAVEQQVQQEVAAARAQPAAQQAVASAVTEAAEQQGPTVQLASTASAVYPTTLVTAPAMPMAYASPALPSAGEALAAQIAATGEDPQYEDGTASMTIAAAPGTAPSAIEALISKYATMYGVPESLVHRVAKRESTYNPRARHRGNYGLMQIRYNTAKGLGYDGSPTGLLDAETNLKYAVKYLRGAWIVAGKDEKAADWLYRTGYYYDAKRKGLLDDIQ